ncbi:MAG: hypothetical protein AAGC77_07490 [Pseudomonadota bacterium]
MTGWVEAWSAEQAAFFGYLAGLLGAILIGLIGWGVAILLARRHAARARLEERSRIACTLAFELENIQHTMRSLSTAWQESTDAVRIRTDLAHMMQVFPQMGATLTTLDRKTLKPLLKAYSLIANYGDILVINEVTPQQDTQDMRSISVAPERARRAARVNESIARQLQWAIDALSAEMDPTQKKPSRKKKPDAPSISKAAQDLQAERIKRPAKNAPQNPVAAQRQLVQRHAAQLEKPRTGEPKKFGAAAMTEAEELEVQRARSPRAALQQKKGRKRRSA